MDQQGKQNHLVGLFETHQQAQAAVENLLAAGYQKDEISVLANLGATETEAATRSNEHSVLSGVTEGLTWGGIAGAALGALALTGPGILISGPLALALTAAGAGVGVIGGGIIGAMNELGVPSENANMYYEAVKRGGVVVSVIAPEEKTDNAAQVLKDAGALNVNRHESDPKGPGWQKVYSAATPDAEPPQPGTQIE